MLVAAGTLTLAFVAYLQIKQNEKLSTDHSRYLKDIDGLTLIFSNYLNEKIQVNKQEQI